MADRRIMECVPNFSEGRDMGIIKQITDVIEQVDGVKLLNVDPGRATNRTVVTFVGDPENVVEAAFRAVRKASEVIDMSKHNGEHPRMGATDVCPLIPVSGVTMEEAAEYARKLAERVGRELNIPVYCYEYAASEEKRRNLSNCREGEYEGLEKKLSDPAWKPDYGPAKFNSRSGATAVGARDFLVAYNINLNTTSVRRANAVAFDVRERGRVKREGNRLTGKIIKGADGEPEMIPGTLKSVKAIGWFIEEYGIAQISINLTDITVTPVHAAFEEVCRKAEARGLRVTGSELVGLIPLKSMLDAGKYFLEKQKRSTGVPDSELIKIAVKSLGLDELGKFEPQKRIIEYMIDGAGDKKLAGMNLRQFMEETASESVAPGGGSISAYMGSLGVALGSMVANLSSHKRGWDDRWREFSGWAEKGKELQNMLLDLVDEDTMAFNRIMQAFGMPKKTEEEIVARKEAIEEATKYAIMVPFRTMKTAFSGYELVREMVNTGNPTSVTDAGVGALAIRACIKGAYLNVMVNSTSLKDREFVDKVLSEAGEIVSRSAKEEEEITEAVIRKLG